MNVEHTPGPWGLSSETSTIIKAYDAFGETKIIIGSASGYKGSPFFPSDETADANARLMAAAPDLLEALQALLPDAVGNHIGGPDTQARIDAARAAIAKATGSAA